MCTNKLEMMKLNTQGSIIVFCIFWLYADWHAGWLTKSKQAKEEQHHHTFVPSQMSHCQTIHKPMYTANKIVAALHILHDSTLHSADLHIHDSLHLPFSAAIMFIIHIHILAASKVTHRTYCMLLGCCQEHLKADVFRMPFKDTLK